MVYLPTSALVDFYGKCIVGKCNIRKKMVVLFRETLNSGMIVICFDVMYLPTGMSCRCLVNGLLRPYISRLFVPPVNGSEINQFRIMIVNRSLPAGHLKGILWQMNKVGPCIMDISYPNCKYPIHV